MWHGFVSSLDTTVHVVIFGCILMGSQHPLATGGIILFFLILAAMLVAESIKDRRADLQSREASPIRIKL